MSCTASGSRCAKRTICNDDLPIYKRDDHIGHCYAPCPFSTQSDDIRSRMMLRDLIVCEGGGDVLARFPNGQFIITDLDAEMTSTLGYSRNDHSTTTGNREDTNSYGVDDYTKYLTFNGTVYMATTSRRGQYGYECAFNDCSYRQNNNGNRYFYS